MFSEKEWDRKSQRGRLKLRMVIFCDKYVSPASWTATRHCRLEVIELFKPGVVRTLRNVKRGALLLLSIFICAFVIGPVAYAAGAATSATPPDRSPAAPVAATLSAITGIAISPLLGTGGYGAYQWFTAKDEAARAKLPWFAQMKFWLPALLLVGVCAAKDAMGATVPTGLKKPLDVLETFENKISALVAVGAVIPFTMDALSKLVLDSKGAALAATGEPGGLAMLQFGAIDFSWLLDVLTIPFGVTVFVVVWMAAHAINVLILLSPWGAIDAALKLARTGVLGLLTLTSAINPWVGAALSLVIILVAWLIAGWSYRLTMFGSIFCWDFFTGRSGRFTPRENDNKMFSGPGFTDLPVRTRGRLVQRTEGGLEFFYRPWPWLPERRATVPVGAPGLAVGRGLFFSTVMTEESVDIFLLPPRYRGHEETLARAYLLGGGVREAGLRKAWSALRDLVGGRAAQPQLT